MVLPYLCGVKRTHLILIALIAIAVAVILSTAGDSSSYENFQVALDNPDEEYHVVGKLVRQDDMQYDPVKDPNYFAFYLEDNNKKTMKVVHRGTKPQDFERSEQVVIIGKAGNDHFEAQKILTKCPSKYVENEVKVKPVSGE